MSDDKPSINVNIAPGIKIEVKTEVPAPAAGRAVNAVLDTISPITEFLGLQGDKLRVYRQLTMAKVLLEAQRQLDEEQRPLTPVPTKTIVPLLEHASQEEPDDNFMVSQWAKLLASAAQQGGLPPRFISLLSELNGRQAAFLASIPRDDGPLTEDLADAIKHNLGPIMGKERGTFDDFSNAVFKHFKEQGQVRFISLAAEYQEDRRLVMRRKQDVWFSVRDNLLDVQILESLGLVRVVRVANWHILPGSNTTALEYLGTTPLGDALLHLTKTAYTRAGVPRTVEVTSPGEN